MKWPLPKWSDIRRITVRHLVKNLPVVTPAETPPSQPHRNPHAAVRLNLGSCEDDEPSLITNRAAARQRDRLPGQGSRTVVVRLTRQGRHCIKKKRKRCAEHHLP
jgi:hypothetical protein